MVLIFKEEDWLNIHELDVKKGGGWSQIKVVILKQRPNDGVKEFVKQGCFNFHENEKMVKDRDDQRIM